MEPIGNSDVIESKSMYEFVKYMEDKPCIYVLINTENEMHLKMYLTEEQYSKTPEFRQKLYKVCS